MDDPLDVKGKGIFFLIATQTLIDIREGTSNVETLEALVRVRPPNFKPFQKIRRRPID